MFDPFHPKGGENLSVFEAIMLMLTFASLIVGLIALVAYIVKNMKK